MKAVNSLLSCEWLQTTRLRASTIARVEVVKSRVAGRSKVHRSPGLLSGSSPSRFRVGARDVVYPPSILRGTTHAEANLGHIVHTRLFNVSSLGVLERARSRRSAAREAARVGKLLAVSCENRSQARPTRGAMWVVEGASSWKTEAWCLRTKATSNTKRIRDDGQLSSWVHFALEKTAEKIKHETRLSRCTGEATGGNRHRSWTGASDHETVIVERLCFKCWKVKKENADPMQQVNVTEWRNGTQTYTSTTGVCSDMSHFGFLIKKRVGTWWSSFFFETGAGMRLVTAGKHAVLSHSTHRE